MTAISIIRDAGSHQANMILTGVYGTLTQAPHEDGHALGRFRIDPEFIRVSYLFSLMDNGEAPVAANSTYTFDAPDEIGMDVKAYLMHSLGVRWSELYKKAAPDVPGLTASMLANEGAKVSAGVRDHLLSMGMSTFLVPVRCTGTTGQTGDMFPTEAALLKHVASGVIQIAIDGDREILGTGVDLLAKPTTQPAADEMPSATTATGQTAWANYSGLDVDFAGSMLVVARSLEQAKELASWCVQQHTNAESPINVQVSPDQMITVRNLELPIDNDGDDDGLYGRERY